MTQMLAPVARDIRRCSQVLVIENNAPCRQRIARALSQEQDLALAGTAVGTQDGLSLVRALKPQVVVLDTALEDGAGLALAAQVRSLCPGTRVVALTPRQDDRELYQAVRAGVWAYVPHTGSIEDVVAATREVAQGQRPIDQALLGRPHIVSHVMEQFQNFLLAVEPDPKAGRLLTAREREILEQIAHGHPSKQIAWALGLKEQSVKNHVSSVLRKLGARDRAHAVFLGLRQGLIAPR